VRVSSVRAGWRSRAGGGDAAAAAGLAGRAALAGYLVSVTDWLSVGLYTKTVKLVAALRARDADRAVEAMRTHLARVSSHLFGEAS